MLCQYYSSSKLHNAPGRTKQRWDWGGASSLVCSISVLHLFHSDGVNTSALLHRCRSLQVSQRLEIALYWCEITRLSLTHSLPGRRRPVFLPAFFFPYTHTRTPTLPSGHERTCTCKHWELVNTRLWQSSPCSQLTLSFCCMSHLTTCLRRCLSGAHQIPAVQPYQTAS